MAHLHVDSLGGASGDMILAALLDLGAPRDEIERILNRLGVGPFRLETREVLDHGIRGRRLTVVPPAERRNGLTAWVHSLSAIVGASSPSHARSQHRGLPEIERLIQNAALPEAVAADAITIFRELANVEARLHGVTPDRVHFHEVGALDALADIVGACAARYLLGASSVTVGPLPVGEGSVTCAHGVLPVPAPAAAELLRNMPTVPFDEPGETVTPTGAAILSVWRSGDRRPAGRWTRIGHGLGQKRWKTRPNLLRLFLMDTIASAAEEATAEHDCCLVIECHLDDQTPEEVGALSLRLLEAGALDVAVSPIFMKKQRPGVRLTVLARPEQADRFRDLLFRESSTFGVRERLETRLVLPRRFETVTTPYGPVRVKIGQWKGRVVSASPEFDDCDALARRAGVPLKEIMAAAVSAWRSRVSS